MPRAISSSKKKDRPQIGRLKGHQRWFCGTPGTTFACRATGRAGDRGLRGKEWASRTHTPLAPRPFLSRAHTLTPLSLIVLPRSLRAQGTPSVGGLRRRDGRCQDAGAEQRLSCGRVRGGRRRQEFPRVAFRERILPRVLHTDHRGYLQTGKRESTTRTGVVSILQRVHVLTIYIFFTAGDLPSVY